MENEFGNAPWLFIQPIFFLSRMALERVPGQDLVPNQSTLSLLSLLKELLNSTSVIEEKPEQQDEIINTILNPLLSSLPVSVTSFPSTDQDVYLLNSLYQIHTTLSLFKVKLIVLPFLRKFSLDPCWYKRDANNKFVKILKFRPNKKKEVLIFSYQRKKRFFFLALTTSKLLIKKV